MSYPWPGFGSFRFYRFDGEVPLPGTDSGWSAPIDIAKKTALGGVGSSITVMGYPAQQRSFNILLSPARHELLKSLVGVSGTFVDWAIAGIDPVAKGAVLTEVAREGELVKVRCADNLVRFRVNTRVSLDSQPTT